MQQDTGAVDTAYRTLKEMAASFAFKPDERLNESAISVQLSISRTPLREALNRLTAEGFLTFRRGQGFHCRSLNPAEMMDLYEARAAIEGETARLAARRAEPGEIAALETYLEQSKSRYTSGVSPIELVRLDEEFHRRIALLSGNAELVRLLDNAAARIQYIRVIDLQLLSERDGAPAITTEPHARILKAVADGDEEGAAREMRSHISRRLEEVTANVRLAFSRLYAP
ncbi:transcriptional regulator, GntR family [Roseovarius nanhaiticus]|uniref:Transcriptional regulator, GntR family n=1 Tax=Roseovarius nanhaiticus TaxID=573024 RepID=A0A1N7ED02_9RHOB|nr:GntR family transcriptional regulator [Roseovarius nanhaiticus]SEK77280.1 transcriptional regulator, GntR family [Roseovarius nanhaiticus]SIR85971.1 transcriptional regulator, GntR family [Roseovarius nanhaiticus]